MSGPAPAPTGRNLAYHGFRTLPDLATGTADGLRVDATGLLLARPTGSREYTDPHTGRTGRYEYASWTSPPVLTGFPVREVIPSWTADTPPGCWLEVELRGHDGTTGVTGWYVLGRWAGDDGTIHPTSVPGQQDDDGRVQTDVLVLAGTRDVPGWQVRVTLLRPTGSTGTPVLRSVGALASGEHGGTAGTGGTSVAPTGPADDAQTGPANGTVLDVPRFSQRLHAGHHPQWGGGGDSWCSPTSVSMVLAWHGAGPVPEEYAWVDPADPRPVVDHAARHCFDHAYAGAGNWPFNTAYAGRYGMDAFVTRLRSLAEAEPFVAAGLPLVLSVAYAVGDVPGLDYDTRGHLLVLVGFTGDGDPVLNDPYAPDDASVRRTVDRARFEHAWQVRASGGVTYVIRPPGVPLPPAPAQANW
ncbi:C39 family peptidase [Micromonospora echinofusca]|uniref:Peptidase C39 family protein n=1 Tax=Micromonospora echinofusca TaxID=47858 RepID=A0ABS3VUF8_MICEH|nr:C39 family peptidase [Micromonospora echinofusca]MBO4208180.1 peptidase C39 family protein [Micromonospora echinofusca]